MYAASGSRGLDARMSTCTVRWRPSGGRGEFEFVPADSLADRDVSLDFEPLGVSIPAEVRGVHAQGKPRLRKHEPRNRGKLHLPQLVMAVTCLPEPRREDQAHRVEFPLENKNFVVDQMTFEVVEGDAETVVLSPLKVAVLHSSLEIDLQSLLRAMARDWQELSGTQQSYPELAEALVAHSLAVRRGVNSRQIRTAADDVIRLKTELFGPSNAGSAHALIEAEAKSAVSAEDIAGREGRLLVRIHTYKERDRQFVRKVRDYYRLQGDGRLTCQACGATPSDTYGGAGEPAMEAHHIVPIEELQPDSEVRIEDMAMLCANRHRVVHSRKPCFTIEEMRELVG